ncbi:MAG: hypothetical protein ABIP34_13295 [Rhodoferax sp.]|uniref:hypothetical protein n=1 Tax=Rhodoferax sp. TaxID=50421 RepID=UPI003267D592
MNDINQLVAAGIRATNAYCYWHNRRTCANLSFSDDYYYADERFKVAEAEVNRIAEQLLTYRRNLGQH